MKISQIETFSNEYEVNEWLKLNHHLEIVNIAIARTDYSRTYLVHYKINGKIETV